MKLQGTWRRTLAMLLVLIFALSNIGLAEVAEQLADIPTVEPAIEEASIEDAPAEEAEEAAEEAEEAAEPAPEVSVEAYLIDEDSIFADAAIENWDYELGYAWERAAVGTEDWEAIEGATESVYVTTAEDRAAYAYRCVVTAGDVAAASNAVEYDTVAFASDEPAESEPVAAPATQLVAVAPPAQQTVGDPAETDQITFDAAKTYILDSAKDTAKTVTLKASAAGASGETYTWAVVEGESYVEIAEDEKTKGATVTITVKNAAFDGLDGDTPHVAKINVTVVDAGTYTGEGQKSQTPAEIIFLKDLEDTDLELTVPENVVNGSETKAANASVKFKKSAEQPATALDENYTASYEIVESGTENGDTLNNSKKLLGVNATTGKFEAGEEGEVTVKDNGTDIGVKVTVKAGAQAVATTKKTLKFWNTPVLDLKKGTASFDVSKEIVLVGTDAVTLDAGIKPNAYAGGVKWSFEGATNNTDDKHYVAFADETGADKPEQEITGTSVTLKAAAGLEAANSAAVQLKVVTGEDDTTGKTINIFALPALNPETLTIDVGTNAALIGGKYVKQEESADITSPLTFSIKAGEAEIDEHYNVAWSVKEAGLVGKWLTATEETGDYKVTVKGNSTSGPYESDNGTTFTVQAKVTYASGQTKELTKELTIRPAVSTATMTVNGKASVEGNHSVDDAFKFVVDVASAKHEGGMDEGAVVKGADTVKSWTVSQDTENNESYTTVEKGKDYTIDEKTDECTITFKHGGKFKVQPTLEGSTLVTAIQGIVVKEYPSSMTAGETGKDTETMTVVNGSNANPKLKVKLGEGDLDVFTDNIEWSVNDGSNEFGADVKYHYLTFQADDVNGGNATTDITKMTGKTEITLAVADDATSSEADKPVVITAKGKIKKEDGTIAPVTLTFKVNVIATKVTGELTAADVSWSNTEIGQPAQTDTTYDPTKAPSWAKATPTVTTTSLKDFPVVWSLGDNGESKYVDLNTTTGEVVVKKAVSSESNVVGKEGKTIAIQAQLRDAAGATAKTVGTITIKPVPSKIVLKKYAATGTDLTDIDAAEAPETESINVLAGSALKFNASLPEGSYGKVISATWQKDTSGTEEETPDPVSLTVVTETPATTSTDKVGDIKGITTNAAGKYKLVVKTDSDVTRTLVVIIQNAPKLGTNTGIKVAGKDGRTDLYYDADTEDELELTVTAVDDQGQTAYTDELVWVLGGTTGIYTNDVNDANRDNLIHLDDVDPNAPSKTEKKLVVPTAVAAKLASSTTNTILVQVYHGSTSRMGTVTLTLKQRLSGDVAIAAGDISFTVSNVTRGTGEAATKLAQGEVAQLVIAPAVKSELNGYTLVYSVNSEDVTPDAELDGADNAEKQANAIARWISIDQTGKITVNAEDATGKKNVIAADEATTGKAFTVKVSVAGLEDAVSAEVTIHVVAAPDHVEIKTYKDPTPETGYADAPYALPKDTSVQLIAVLVGPKKNGTVYTTAGNVPALTTEPASAPRYFTFVQDEEESGVGATKTKTDHYTLTALDAMTVNVKATSWNGKSVTQPILLINEKIELADGAPEKCTDGSAHVWVLDKTKSTAKTHVYKCATQDCTATSKPIAHSGWHVVANVKDPATGELYSDEEVLWDSAEADAKGSVKCVICEHECEHKSLPTTGGVYKNGSYHEIVCPDCQMTLRQKHVDSNHDNKCDICTGSASTPEFVNGAVAVVNGANYIPDLVVPDTQTWSAIYKVEDDSKEYIELVDEKTGEVKGLKPTPEKTPAKLTATITVKTGTFTDTITETAFVKVYNQITDITIESDKKDAITGKAYVIKDGTLLHLTSNIAPESPYTEGYEWSIDDDSKDNIEFVGVDKNGAVLAAQPTQAVLKANVKEVYLRVKSGASVSEPAKAKVTLSTSADPAAGQPAFASQSIEVDILPKLEDEAVKTAITFDGKKSEAAEPGLTIVQGDSATVTLEDWTGGDNKSKPFETRYGEVTYSVEDAAVDNKMNAADTAKWISIDPRTGVLQTVAANGASNKLDASRKYKEFKVTATVTRDTINAVTKKPDTVVASRTVKIIPAPANVEIQYLETTATGSQKWSAIPATGLTASTVKDVILRAVITAPKDGNTELTTISEPDIDWKNSVTDSNIATLTDVAASEIPDVTGATKPDVAKKLKIKTTDGAPEEITVTASCFGVTKEIKIKVEKLIESITLNCDVTEIGAGETTVENGVTTLKTIKITATTVPENVDPAIDSIDLTADSTDVSLTKVQGENAWTFQLPGQRSEEPLTNPAVTFTATPAHDPDGSTVKATHVIKIYKTPTDSNALTLTTEKSGAANTLTLTVGESTTITEHGWLKESAFGSSADAPVSDPEGKNDAPTAAADAGKKVISVEKDEASGKWIVTGKVVGEADIAIHPYNYEENPNTEKKLHVVVTPAVDRLDTDATKLAAPYEIDMGSATANSVTIPKDAFTAIRVDATTERETDATDAMITLKVEKPIVKVSTTTTGWKLEGVEDGETTVTAWVNENAHSEPITVVVKSAATGIKFVDSEGKDVGAQKKLYLKDAAQVVLTAVAEPATAYGTITTAVTGDAVTRLAGETGTTVSITPAKTGTATITATIPNPAWKTGDTSTPNHPENFKASLEILVVDEESKQETTYNAAVQFAGKAAIGPDETTKAVLVGVDETVTPTWQIIEGNDCAKLESATTGDISWVKEGQATIQAVDAAGNPIAEGTVYTMTAPTKVAFSAPAELSIGQGITVDPIVVEGYAFSDLEENPVEIDYSDLFSLESNSPTVVQVTEVAGQGKSKEHFVVTGLAEGTAKLTLKTVGKAEADEITVTVGAKAIKKFTLPYNNSTIYIAPGKDKTIVPVIKPATATAHLSWTVEPAYGYVVYDAETEEERYVDPNLITIENGKISVDAEATPGDTYKVTASIDGMTAAIPSQSFLLVVGADPAEATGLKIDVDKYGVENAYAAPNTGTVTVVKGEKLQLKVVDENNIPVDATATWTVNKAGKSAVTLNKTTGLVTANAKGTAKITGNVNGTSLTFTVKVVAAPQTKQFKLTPSNETAYNVAVGEEFQLGVDATAYNGTASKIYTISWTGMAPTPVIDDETGGVKADWYTFDDPDMTGVATATITTTWGKTKTVTFNVTDDALATNVELDQDLTIVKGKTLRIRAKLTDDDGEPAKANLIWTVGGTTVTTANQATSDYNRIKVKLLANDEIQLTATGTAKNGNSVAVTATAQNDETLTAKTTVTVGAAGSKDELAGATVVFDKAVIGKGEKTRMTIKMPEGQKVPAGGITFKASKVKKEGRATVSGDTIKGTTEGPVTVTAYLNGKKTEATGVLTVLSAATITADWIPKTMPIDSIEFVNLTIGGYAGAATAEQITISDVVTGVTTSDDRIIATLEADPTETETDANARKYILTLYAAGTPEKDAKGKNKTTTVTVSLNNGTKLSMPIQITEAPSIAEIYVPSEIYLQKGKSVALTAAFGEGAAYGAAFSWKFVDPAAAAAAKLTLSANGTVKANSKAANGASAEIEGKVVLYDSERTFKTKVIVGKAVTKKNQIDINFPKASIAVGEKMLAQAAFKGGAGSAKVTWGTKTKDLVTIDSKTGLITAKAVGEATITAKVSGKTASAKIQVVAAPKSISFTEKTVQVERDKPVDLLKLVTVDGSGKATVPAMETAFSFKVTDYGVGHNEETDEYTTIIESCDIRTGEVKIAADALDGVAKVKVTTYNGLSDEIVLVLGEVEGGTVTPPEPQVPATIELQANGDPLTDAQSIALVEEQTFKPTLIVKDEKGEEIANPTVKWEATNVNAVSIATDGTLTAMHHTINATTNLPDSVTITATVEGVDPVSYKVTIAPKLRVENMDLEIDKPKMIMGDTVPAKAQFKITAPGLDDNGLTVEVTTKDNAVIGLVKDNLLANTWNLTAKGVGEATLTVNVKDANGTIADTFTKTVTVNPQPTEITLVNPADGKLVLGSGETGAIEIQMAEGFVGTPDASKIVAKAYQASTYTEDAPGREADGITFQHSTTGTGLDAKEEPCKFDVTGTAAGTYKVVVTAYDKAKVVFDLEIKTAPTLADDIKLDGTPKPDGSDSTYTVTAGIGETVNLSAELAAAVATSKYWNAGLEWKLNGYAEDATDKPAFEQGDGKATLTYTGTARADISLTLGLKGNTDLTNVITVTVTYLPVPEYGATGVTGNPEITANALYKSADIYNIGVKEKLTASIAFDNSHYTSQVKWTTSDNGSNVKLLKSEGEVCEFQGVNPTGTGTVNVIAWYGTVKLGEIKVKVANAPTEDNFELVLTDIDSATQKNKPFDYVITYDTGSTEKEVTVDIGNASATFTLESSNKNAVDVVAESDKKNTWTLKCNANNVASYVTLTLKSADNGLVKRYNLKITDYDAPTP